VKRRVFLRGLILLGCVLVAGIAAAAFVPVRYDSKEELFEIPKGTWARRMAGEKVEILPSDIHLVTRIHDVLVLKNLDDVPQIFGPTLMMPGQSLSLPFEVASDYEFACTAHLSGHMTVSVAEEPRWPWQRLWWRAKESTQWMSQHWKRSAK
jgi:hypothetical protein